MAVERKLIAEHKRKVQVREFLHKETERAGFGGADVQRTPMGTRINLVAERPGFVIGRRGSTIKKLTEDLATRFELDNPQIEVQEADNPALNPQIMAMKLAEALERGWHFRRAGHSTLRRIMESGARGALIRVSGKLTGGRSRVQKFVDGHIKYCGDTALVHMHKGFSVAKKKLGTIGVLVAIMDPDAKLPDEIEITAEGAAPAPGAVRGESQQARAAAEAEATVGTGQASGETAAKQPGQPGGEKAPQAATEDAKVEDAPAAADVPEEATPVVAESTEAAGGFGDKALTDIEGVGPKKAQALEAAGFASLDALEGADEAAIAEVEGIGPALAKKIKDELTRMKE